MGKRTVLSVNTKLDTAEEGATSTEARRTLAGLLDDGQEPETSGHQTPTLAQSPSFISNVMSNFKKSEVSKVESPSGTGTLGSTDSPQSNNVSSPSIISHRRQTSISSQKRKSSRKSIDSSSTPKAAQTPKQPVQIISHRSTFDVTETSPEPTAVKEDSELDEFNRKKFVNEKYLNTEHHYATPERDADFHVVFEEIDQNDRLLDDFSCALSKDFLYQGRLYITESALCFNSNILGWVSKLVIPLRDVRYMEKTTSGGLFPNAIMIETNRERTQFNNFISREKTFALIKEVWSSNLLKADFSKDTFDTESRSSRDSSFSEQPELINEKSLLLGSTNDTIDVFKFNDDANFINEPPYYVPEPTDFPDEKDHPNEYLVTTLDLDCTPWEAFQIMYSNTNHSFLMDFLKECDCTDIKDPSEFNSEKSREYSYEKPLNYPGGPKSTQCLVEEFIEHQDNSGYIKLLNTTRTPNVPSGGAFSTKTKYLFRWSTNTNCQLQVSYWLEWTGSSWFKKMIESGAKKGQIDACEKMTPILKGYVNDNIKIETIPRMTKIKISARHDLEKQESTATLEGKNARHRKSDSTLILFVLLIIFIILVTVDIINQRALRKSILNIERILVESKR
ncbi:Lam5p KNAG_0E03040 [Huiozyma naganishii CBS 8797]|uniref:VASt domain-containing protein n=1 Tax=Huiozyma naganishii (strain ATCC MYA-139 / BCRC 22969 / CBS 8797 / KCTC 17520 / NBRC 10181 / NCYC 3082 / Yp74L-3) TaxID=1071383 RepID=J7RLZ5_HUIN7|nr:hypothetical protein KNAG_0E03040 [Kazachstania naganishii CBS 8797]CCK70563.1 hypothetical protein KNAG_0E03040 [Kazachstania naganishii CBS 8797]